MANNTILNVGAGGDVISTEDIGAGVKLARTKLVLGVTGTDSLDVSAANPMPVSVTNVVGSPVPVSQAVASQADGHSATIGATADIITANTLVGLLKNIKASLLGTLTTVLAAGTAIIGIVSSTQRTDKMMIGAVETTPLFAVINSAASGDNTLVALTAGKKIRVLRYSLIVAGAVNATFKSSAGSALSGARALAANGGVGGTFCPVGHFESLVGEGLLLNLSAAVQASGDLTYILI